MISAFARTALLLGALLATAVPAHCAPVADLPAPLLLSALPSFGGQPGAPKLRIEDAALPHTSTTMCGDVAGATVPNNAYGYGRLDATATYDGVPSATLDIEAYLDKWMALSPEQQG